MSMTPRYLEPKDCRIKSDVSIRVLIDKVQILDCTGRQPFPGSVYVVGDRVERVLENQEEIEHLKQTQADRLTVVNGQGRTLLPGLGDAHTHFTWNEGDLFALGELPVEEHLLATVKSAELYLDSGYTMCFGAASAKDRLDVVVRDGIQRGDLKGPRYLANAREIAKEGGDLVAGITAFANNKEEMIQRIQENYSLGVDQVKLSISGEGLADKPADDSYFTQEEVSACVEKAHDLGLRVCTHARSNESVKQSVLGGVDVIYHASYANDETIALLEQNKENFVLAPGLNWLYNTIHEAEPFGVTKEKAKELGYVEELEIAIEGLKKMKARGITLLPGGDYGFAWTPHGTYARDLWHFVELLGFTPMEAILSATAEIGDKLFLRPNELGKIQNGFYADMILVNGNPLEDITILQDKSKLDMIMINGKLHKLDNKLVK